jgi:hypothetical protein
MKMILDEEITQALVAVGEILRKEYGWSIEGDSHIPTNPDGHFVTILKEHLAFLLDENIIKLLLNAKADAMMAEAIAMKKIACPDWLDGEEEN